ncbi:hypothetical protein B9Q03_12870 [Candidatus Marsarchaeota G2 archaeon OSP_D]|jgi:hypothetical protein|uniref:Uncharacterized protein n=2 Tax=Candidatus Marsarchaeota group 2 TaxID=2203771 RepID=A0A2R6CD27_9ARCH|nr:MAG: hypothetical protein B9Q03_12870 [Candidatus Marsarchaeota G2 archaeon OSP_D]PSO08794.1 MAG: hypothetical protein B9Q04_03730 [Candidatus Marsarchaeota G2 archaeon BE_D]
MIYITDSKGEGSPCLKVYDGNVLKWYYCNDERELFSSLINLLKGEKNFRIYNVYGKRIYIPHEPREFVVKEGLEEFEGVIYDLSKVLTLIKISKEVNLHKRFVKVKLKDKVNAEEILKLGIRIVKPIQLPSLYGSRE